MVVVWGNILSLWGNVFAIAVDILVFDAFFPHNDNRKKRWSYILLFCLIFTSLSILIGTKLGYTFKMLQEIALIYVLCVFLYQSRWDRRFFIVVTVYSVLFSYSHWFESFCLYAGNLDYEEYIWNVPLYSVLFFVRGFISLFVALIIKKYHHPLHARTRASTWVPLSAVFPVCTLLVLRQVYTYPEEQRVWQICLLILDLVDIAALILLDYLEENAENREKLIAANERAHVQDENIQALSQAYAGQRKMTHDFRANLSTLSELLESERVDDAKEFLSELNVRQSERILLVNSHNAAIDAVLNQKGSLTREVSNTRGKLTIRMDGSYSTSGNSLTAFFSAMGNWSGTGSDPSACPSSGADVAGFHWGGNISTGETTARGEYGDNSSATVTLAGGTSNEAIAWYFTEKEAFKYIKNVFFNLNMSKSSLTGNGNTTELYFTYIHTYQSYNVTGSISASGAGISISNVANQWPLSVRLYGIPY